MSGTHVLNQITKTALESQMKATTARSESLIPKRRQKHYSYDESVNKPAKLIEDEPVETEEEVPAEENEPLERIEKSDESEAPAFEE